MTISNQKKQARLAAMGRRNQCADPDKVQVANDNLLASILEQTPRVVSGYLPIGSEIDPVPTMTKLLDHGVRVCVPVVLGDAMPLGFREWSPDSVLEKASFGVMVPKKGAWLDPDMITTPLLAYNEKGYRLGYGGGFYDRSLQKLRAKHPVTAIGFAFSGQYGDVPTEATDQKLDQIVTENGVVNIQS